MFETLIEELKSEIKDIDVNRKKQELKLEEDCYFLKSNKPKIEKKLKELEEKCVSLEDCNVSDVELKAKLEVALAKCYNAQKDKEEKKSALYDQTKFEKLCAIKRKIAKIIDIINDQKEKDILAGKKFYESNEEFDIKAFGNQIKSYDRFIESLEKINMYNGGIRRDEYCVNLMNELDEEYAVIINELYKIIVTHLLDMRKEVSLEDLNLKIESKENEVEPDSNVSEEIEESKELEQGIDVFEDKIEEEIEESKELEQDIDVFEEKIEEEIEESKELEQDIDVFEDKIDEEVEEEKTFEELLEEKTKSLDNESTRFLELCNYVKLHLNQENIENLTEEYQLLQEECEACDVCYKSLVNTYNSLVENKSKKIVTKSTLETFGKCKIIKEYFKAPFRLIKNSSYSEKRAYKRLEKIVDRALKHPKTSNEYIEKIEKAKVLESKIVKKYMVKGVKLFKAKNKLAKMKVKLYSNDNQFSSKAFERKFAKQTRIISNKLEPKLNSLTKRTLKCNNEECVCLVLNQYLDLLSNCHIKDLEQFYVNYSNYLYSIEEKIGEDYYSAYKMAGIMIFEYRSEYKLPYDLMKYNLDSGEVYNEIEDIINFYQFEIENPNKNVLYIKRS